MKQKKKILSKYKRRVTIFGEEWTYRITSRTIHICNPERTEKRTFFTNQYSSHDCDSYDCYFCDMGWEESAAPIKPSDVIKVIKDKILDLDNFWPGVDGSKENPISI